MVELEDLHIRSGQLAESIEAKTCIFYQYWSFDLFIDVNQIISVVQVLYNRGEGMNVRYQQL